MGIIPDSLKAVTTVKQVFITEKDEDAFQKKAPRYTPLFRSPLVDHAHYYTHGHRAHKGDHHAIDGSTNSPPEQNVEEEEEEEHEHEVILEGEPRLVRARETSVVQLFYDLFFVANLTTFTSKHEINDTDTLRDYLAFFVILWATWFQVAKYDVRFGNDSAFERICKALQFGIMVGFAITGPQFHVVWEVDTPLAVSSLQIYQTLTLILMASRLILSAQYLSVYYWLREFPKAHFPLLVHISASFISAMVFLGLYFSFSPSSPGNAGLGIIGWYLVLALESAAILLASGSVRFMSFRHTPMVERLGLLTLIILGEGVIGLCNAISKVGTSLSFSADVVGQIISAVAVIYFVWMLYFDQTEKKRVGRLRQELWTVLHFPFHICLLLLVEGQATLTVWLKIQDITNPLVNYAFNSDILNAALFNNTNPEGAVLDTFINGLNMTINSIYAQLPSDTDFSEIYDAVAETKDGGANATDFVYNSLTAVFGAYVSVCEAFAVEAPNAKEDLVDDPTGMTSTNDIVNVFYTVYTYFFIAAGFALIILTLLLRLGKREKYRSEMFVMIFRFLIGAGLALLALMNLPSLSNSDNSALAVYITSPWMIPTVAIAYALVLLVDNLVANHIRKKYNQWRVRSNSLA